MQHLVPVQPGVGQYSKESLKHQTIKSYLDAVRHTQILAEWGDPLIHGMPLLEYVLRGVKSEQAKNPTSSQRIHLPITPAILRKVHHALENDRTNYDHVMLWVVYCTAFFGFLRSGEITVLLLAAYDPGAHLSYVWGHNIQQPNSPNTCPGKYKSF